MQPGICTQFEDSGGSRVGYLEDALHQWRSQLPASYQDAAEEIRAVMLTVPPPEDWIPQNADDSILVSLFHQHWHADQSARPISAASGDVHGVGVRTEEA